MSGRFWNARWSNNQAIILKFLDNGECPFDVQLAADQLRHQADFLEYLTGRTIRYEGVVKEDTDQTGVIYSRYVHRPDVTNEFWANAITRHEPVTNNIRGAMLSYRREKMPLPEHFAGLFVHELFHGLAFAHWNATRTIMKNAPYLNYMWQGLPTLDDYRALGMLFPGPMPKLYPSVYDFGDLRQEKCIIHIPLIEWSPRNYVSVYLNGAQDANKDWILSASDQDIRQEQYAGTPQAFIDRDVLHLPLRYMEQSIWITATLIEYNGPQSKVRFKVDKIAPREG